MIGAIVLAGGRASRLGGADKAAVSVAGRALVDYAYAAVSGCSPVVAVGPASLARPGVREEPPFGGPVAAVAAGVAALEPDEPDEVWLLACDLPRAPALVAALAGAAIPTGRDGVVAVDGEGRMQWLAGRYQVASLRAALAAVGEVDGASMRRLLAPLRLREVAVGDLAIDLDTWDAIAAYPANESETAEGTSDG
jgi:molybdopterin-guanine dinucleotide biosynthesis protein A